MEYDIILQATNTIVILGTALPTLYMARRIQVPSLRRLTVLFASFFLLHGIYHFMGYLALAYESSFVIASNARLFGDLVEPFGGAFLLAFALYLAKRGR